jgi:hypothetical protein
MKLCHKLVETVTRIKRQLAQLLLTMGGLIVAWSERKDDLGISLKLQVSC